MKPQKILNNSKKYNKLLCDNGYSPKQINLEYKGTDKTMWLKHACWMTTNIPGLIESGEVSKAKRWQSYVQACLNLYGFLSVKDVMIDSMPDGSTFDPHK